MKRNYIVKNNHVGSNSSIFNEDSFKTSEGKAKLEHHYVVPWEIVNNNKVTINRKKKERTTPSQANGVSESTLKTQSYYFLP